MATFVLIPGAGGEAWYWHRVASDLNSFGHEAIAVDLPAGDDTAGWDEYAAAVERAMDGRTDVILVAQSLAGFSAPIVADRQRVDLLVLVNAMIPARRDGPPGVRHARAGRPSWRTSPGSASRPRQ